MKRVQCVPGGHEVSIDHAYWCSSCGFYVCPSHVVTRFLSPTVRCRRGHRVTRAR